MILFTGGRGVVCLSACWDTDPPGSRHPTRADTPHPSRHPQEQTPPWSRHPLDQTPPRSRHPSLGADPPPEQTPPRPDTPRPDTPLGADTPTPPRCRACWEIRSTRGQYATFWNAMLFSFFSKSLTTMLKQLISHVR